MAQISIIDQVIGGRLQRNQEYVTPAQYVAAKGYNVSGLQLSIERNGEVLSDQDWEERLRDGDRVSISMGKVKSGS